MDILDELARSALKRIDTGYYSRGRGLNRWNPVSLRADPRLVAEVKPASPSEGYLLGDRDPVDVIQLYARGGACGISVLTDPDHFGGSLELLSTAADTGLPVLMKDFILHPDQILAGVDCGASVFLAIMTLFDRGYARCTLEEFIEVVHSNGCEVLLEVATRDEYSRAVATGADLIGINNRDLRTMNVDIGRTPAIVENQERGAPILSLSGISRPEHIHQLLDVADGFLIGTTLLRADDPTRLLGELLAACS